MNIDDAFPSSYLKAADLQGRSITVTIADCKFETLGDETKAVIYFQGKDKAMVCNKTNATTLKDAYGSDTDLWRGKKIELYSERVPFQGRIVDGLRVRAAQRVDIQAPPKAPPAPATAEPMDDDLPF